MKIHHFVLLIIAIATCLFILADTFAKAKSTDAGVVHVVNPLGP